MKFEDHWKHKIEVRRQKSQEANFAFILDGVLFIGLNLVNQTRQDESRWRQRQADALNWVRKNILNYGADSSSVVIFSHPLSGIPRAIADYGICEEVPENLWEAHIEKDRFLSPFEQLAGEFKKPILFLHGNEHCWKEDFPLKKAPNVKRIIVDRTGIKSPIAKVTVSRKGSQDEFLLDRRESAKIDMFREDAENGDPYAQYKIGSIFLSQSEEGALKWFHKGADQNYPLSMFLHLLTLYQFLEFFYNLH